MLTSLLQLPAAGTKLHGHSTATSLPCGNRNGFIQLTATQETKPSIRYPNNPLQDGGGACGGGGASRLATFVVRLYCAPLVGICKRQQDVNQGRSEDGDRGTLWRGLYPQNCHPFNFNEVRNSLFGCHGDDGGLGCVWGGGGRSQLTHLVPLGSFCPSVRQKSWFCVLEGKCWETLQKLN